MVTMVTQPMEMGVADSKFSKCEITVVPTMLAVTFVGMAKEMPPKTSATRWKNNAPLMHRLYGMISNKVILLVFVVDMDEDDDGEAVVTIVGDPLLTVDFDATVDDDDDDDN